MANKDSKTFISEVAFQCFTQNGYKATTIAQLVQASGMSKGAFYHHFKSKQEVYEHVVETFFLAYYKELDWSEVAELPLKQVLEVIPQRFSEFIREVKRFTQGEVSKYYVLFFEAFANIPTFRTTAQAFYSGFKALLCEKLLAETTATAQEAEIEATRTIALYEGLFFWAAVFPDQDIEQYLSQFNAQ